MKIGLESRFPTTVVINGRVGCGIEEQRACIDELRDDTWIHGIECRVGCTKEKMAVPHLGRAFSRHRCLGARVAFDDRHLAEMLGKYASAYEPRNTPADDDCT